MTQSVMKEQERFAPSNSDDGLWFEERWCCHCERDRGYRESNYTLPVLGCVTLAIAWCEGESPEWVYDENHYPICKQYVPEGEEIPAAPIPGQLGFEDALRPDDQ